jgi:hypothetical protein
LYLHLALAARLLYHLAYVGFITPR